MDTRTVAVYMATYYELFWVLDSAQQALVIGSRVEDFEGDAGSWGLAHANILAAVGRSGAVPRLRRLRPRRLRPGPGRDAG